MLLARFLWIAASLLWANSSWVRGLHAAAKAQDSTTRYVAGQIIDFHAMFLSLLSGSLVCELCIQVASLALLAQLLPPRSPTVSNPAPDSSLCRAAAPRLRPLAPPIASASAGARPLRPLRISCCSLARLHPLQLLLPVCVHFQLLLPDNSDCTRFSCCCMLAACVRFSCCSRSRPLRLLLPDCVHFDCCSPTACIHLQPQLDSRLHASACSPSWIPAQCS